MANSLSTIVDFHDLGDLGRVIACVESKGDSKGSIGVPKSAPRRPSETPWTQSLCLKRKLFFGFCDVSMYIYIYI